MPLNREQMIETVRGGGSVIYKGKLIAKEENIPGVAEFAMTDEQRSAERERLQKELAALDEKPSSNKEKSSGEKEKSYGNYPDDFPMAQILHGLNIKFEDAAKMTREELIGLEGIGDKSADKILAYGK